MPDPPTLYTTRQLADAAGLSYKRILQLVRQYDLGTMHGPVSRTSPAPPEAFTPTPAPPPTNTLRQAWTDCPVPTTCHPRDRAP